MSQLRSSRVWLYTAAYTLLLSLAGFFIVQFSLPLTLLLLFSIPIPLAAFYDSRRLYLLSLSIFIALTGLAFYLAPVRATPTPIPGLLSAWVTIFVISEMIYRLQIRQRALEARLQASEERYRAIFESNPLAVALVDLKTFCIVDANQKLLDLLGYSLEQLRVFSIAQITPAADLTQEMDAAGQVLSGGKGSQTVEKRLRTRSGELRWVRLTITLVRATAGQMSFGLGMIEDIHEQKQRDEELQRLQMRYRRLAEQTTAVTYIESFGEEHSRMLYISPQIEALSGYAQQEWLVEGGFWWKVVHPDDLAATRAENLRCNQRGEPFVAEYRLQTRDGRIIWLHDEAVQIDDADSGEKLWHGILLDVTQRRQIEQSLGESEERYRKLIELLPDTVFVNQDGDIVFANPAFAHMMGFADPQEMHGIPALSLVRADFEPLVRERMRRSSAGLPNEVTQIVFITCDHREVRMEVISAPILYQGRPAGLVVGRDVTQRWLAEEALRTSETRFRAMVETLPGMLHICDLTGKNSYVSPKSTLITGYTPQELTGAFLWWVHPDDTPTMQRIFERSLQAETNVSNLEYKAVRKNGEIWYASTSWQAVKGDDGNLQGYIMLTTDVTARKENEQILRTLARENTLLLEQARQDTAAKGVLLDEVNHRVKNNLASILGILEMETASDWQNVEDARESMVNVQNRIRSLAAVHELLSSADWAPLDLYQLSLQIVQGALNNSPLRHAIHLQIDSPLMPIYVQAREATALALILNELTINSIKYAFRQRGKGRISVKINSCNPQESDLVCICYADDGPGWPEDVLNGQRQGLGLQLVRLSMRSPLRGQLTLQNEGGAQALLSFRLAPPPEPPHPWQEMILE